MPSSPPPLAYAPLLPIAVAATVGLVADRYCSIPILFSLGSTLLCLIAWALARQQKNRNRACIYLWASWMGIAAAYHHAVRDLYADDDIGAVARDEPSLLQVRGTIFEEPVTPLRPSNNPLASMPRKEWTHFTIDTSELRHEGGWQRASGRAMVHIEGRLEGLHVGDEIEITGWIARPMPPMNPGEWDYAARLRDRRIRAEIRVKRRDESIIRRGESGRSSFAGALALVRAWGQRTLQRQLPPSTSGVATALLLGEGSAMTSEDWEKYVRTGVVHVLAISGQHLVILGAFLWFMLRVAGVRRRRAAWFVASIMILYALLTGGRPSAMRAAVMVSAVCVGILLRRPALPANTFSLAWMIVLLLDPTDLFTAGFQLSFLCVAILLWGIPRWFPPREPDALDRLIDESRSARERCLRALIRAIGSWYRITLVLSIATTPLVIYWQNIISPAGVLIGPLMILLTSIALVAGFLLLLIASVLSSAAVPFAWITQQCLMIGESIVGSADHFPGGCWYVPDIPLWWLVGFYGLLIAWMATAKLIVPSSTGTVRPVPMMRPSIFAGIVCAWSCIGLLATVWRPDSDELRVTFLAVGHGSCIVVETPDGRVFLYDAGAVTGPEVTRRNIAPFLWSRGIRRIDEIFLSHADLDHFNGLPALLDRFSVGIITLTPSFEQKHAPGVRHALARIRNAGIAVREAREDDQFRAGDVTISVLHPPSVGPEGLENVRSLVLLIEHLGHRILLTGDLEKNGLRRFLDRHPLRVDVLMAPHHGSLAANNTELAVKTQPKLVVACDGPKQLNAKDETVYAKLKIPYWVTWPHGAITIHSHRSGLTAETYRTRQRRDILNESKP